MMRRFLVLSAVIGLTGCPGGEEPSLSLGAPAVVTDDGVPAKLTARATGTGTVTFQTTGGTLSATSVMLNNGVAAAELRCDARCPKQVEVTATWGTFTQTRSLNLTHPVVIDAGIDAGVDAGVDGGLALVTGKPPLWWYSDGGLYWVPTGEEAPAYTCESWDGGPHPGYTVPDGGPLARGCALEPIDFLFIESSSPTAVNVCGTVEFTMPVKVPVYPRGSLSGRFKILNMGQAGAWKLQCLRDPSHLTYRFQLEPDAGIILGMGVRSSALDTTLDAGLSLYGFYDGTFNAPITEEDAGTELLINATAKSGVDFSIGPGKRPGDP